MKKAENRVSCVPVENDFGTHGLRRKQGQAVGFLHMGASAWARKMGAVADGYIDPSRVEKCVLKRKSKMVCHQACMVSFVTLGLCRCYRQCGKLRSVAPQGGRKDRAIETP
ncbi:hypothetical protein Sj15T_10460 [Sphingobium sp. TA15]|nr:hypothetical protein Sj15T_10460 [Sphingobium sp. TA15]